MSMVVSHTRLHFFKHSTTCTFNCCLQYFRFQCERLWHSIIEMATLVCFWKVKCSQKVTKTTVFTERNFNRKCQSHVWFWFCSRGMFTQRLRKPLVLPRECEPQASNTTCGFASIGVACSKLVACQENSIAAKTSMF